MRCRFLGDGGEYFVHTARGPPWCIYLAHVRGCNPRACNSRRHHGHVLLIAVVNFMQNIIPNSHSVCSTWNTCVTHTHKYTGPSGRDALAQFMSTDEAALTGTGVRARARARALGLVLTLDHYALARARALLQRANDADTGTPLNACHTLACSLTHAHIM